MKNTFSNYVDLPLYQAVRDLFALPGCYHFGSCLRDECVTVDQILNDLKNPTDLQKEQLRAYALAVAGTPFETVELVKCVLQCVEGDVFLAVAATYFNNGSEKKLMQRCILQSELPSVAENIMALTVFWEEWYKAESLLQRITMLLVGDISSCFGNPKMFRYLFDFNAASDYKSELVTLLSSVMRNVPDKNSRTLSVLKDYALRTLDVYEMAYFLRRETCSRISQKTDIVTQYLKEELAQYYSKWTDWDKYFVKCFHGKLGYRIYSKYNFAFYHDEYGFSLPELSVNVSDDIAMETMTEVLTERERCFVAKHLGLQKKELGRLGARFKDWDKDLQEYYASVAPIRGVNNCYKVSSMTLDEVIEKYGLESDECYAKVTTMDELDNAEQFVNLVFEHSLLEFVNFIRKHRIKPDEESQEKFHVLQNAPLNLLERCNSYEEVKDLSEFSWDKELLELSRTTGCQNVSMLRLIRENGGQPELVSVLQEFGNQYDFECWYPKLSMWSKEGTLSKRLQKLPEEQDAETKCFLKLSLGCAGKEFRQWTNLITHDCLERWPLVAKFLDVYESDIKSARKNAQYDAIMSDVIREWVKTGSPFKCMNQKRNLTSLLGAKCDYQRTWLSIAEKSVEDALTLANMDVNYGTVDGVRCWMTSVGLIVDEVNEKLQNSGIPLFGASDVGEPTKVFVGAPLGDYKYNSFLRKRLYCDEEVTVRLIKW